MNKDIYNSLPKELQELEDMIQSGEAESNPEKYADKLKKTKLFKEYEEDK